MKKLVMIGLALVLASACGSNTQSKNKTAQAAVDQNTVNVYYFHGKQRCMTCNTVEAVAKKAVQDLYAGNSKVVFRAVNMDEKANEALVEQYQIGWSSLIIAKGNQHVDLTEVGFGNAVDNPAQLEAAIKAEVDKLL